MNLDLPCAWFVTKAYTVPEFAELFGISVSQALAHVRDGTVVAVNVGRGETRRDLRVTDEAIDAFVKERATKAVRSVPSTGKGNPIRSAKPASSTSPAPDSYAARREARWAVKGSKGSKRSKP